MSKPSIVSSLYAFADLRFHEDEIRLIKDMMERGEIIVRASGRVTNSRPPTAEESALYPGCTEVVDGMELISVGLVPKKDCA